MGLAAEGPRVLSLLPGRVRLHLPGWAGGDGERIEDRLRRVNGVESVQANPRTGNALIRFDRRAADENALLLELQEAWYSIARSEDAAVPPSSHLTPFSTAIRVGVRGLLGHAVVDSVWFGAGFLGKALGLALAALGPLHVLMDIAVWMIALTGPKSGAGLSEGSKRSQSPQR
jgi:copper chaperone CopZ